MSEQVSAGEFDRTMTALREDVRAGFQGVHDRLDTLNGQTRRHGESIAAHEQRLTAMDRELRDLKRPAFPRNRVVTEGREPRGDSLVVSPGFSNAQKFAAYGAGAGAFALAFAKAMGWL